MAQLAHYCEAFSLESKRCFRLILAEDGTGHAQHCPYITEWRGRFQDRAGNWHTVESCEGHRADLDSVQRIAADPHRMLQKNRKQAYWT